RRQHAAWAMGGALYACAGLLKPPLGGGMLVSAWLISRALRREGAPTRARLLALEAIFAGALLPVLATIAWFARHGALGDAIETLFVFAPGYTRLSLQSHSVWQLCAGTVRELVRVIAVPSLIGCALWALLPSGEAREGETPLHLIGALAPQLLGVALQAKLFPYHYGGIVPLAALFAGWGLWRIGRRLTHPAAALLGLMLLTLLVYESPPVTPDLPDFWTRCQVRIGTLLQPSRKIAADDRLYSVADVDAGANRRLAQWLRVHTAPQAPVFLWGFEPIVYTLADRAPATRYLYDVPQRARWSRERARRRMMADLAQAPPSAIVIERGDMLPLVTGDRLDSAQALLHFPELARLITESYHPAVRFERFDVYLRDQGAQR
ncbi:MAG: hypothetical protein ACHQ17_13670, partial [Polyangia bacterium]